MKRHIILIVSIVGFSLTSQKATAQWDLLSNFLQQADTSDVSNGSFDFLDTSFVLPVDFGQGTGLLQDLYGELENPFPGGTLDSTFIFGLDAGLDSLFGNNGNFGFSGTDLDSVLNEFDSIQVIFGNNFDSLGGLFGQYQDSLVFGQPAWDPVVINFDSLNNHNLSVLQDTFGMMFDTTDFSNPGNFSGIIETLLDVDYFPDLELAFGTQQGDFKYWEEGYSETAKVLRIGSVPRFDRVAADCHDGVTRLPIEARWHLQASFTGGERTPSNDGNRGNETQSREEGDSKGFNPLLLGGDYALMATPNLGRLGNTYFKLITSLGIEFGTYAPAHRDFAPPFTTGNRGFATGFGPQFGGGFSMTTGQLIVYTMATVAHGGVLRCPLPYHYDNKRIEVGMRYGNIINVRYSTGMTTWQPDDNRRANVKHQFTIGIILPDLHH